MTVLTGSIQHARATEAQWTTNNPVLLDGQIYISSDVFYSGTSPKFKIGKGTTWSTTDYVPIGTAAVWGNISGLLGDQADLVAAFATKQNDIHGSVDPAGVISFDITGSAPGLKFMRHEAQPAAPTAALIATASGNATNGSHVFAVVFRTISGQTEVSPISNAVTVDASHKQVTVTIPQGSNYVVNRDIYASKAGTTSPLYLIASSPVVNYAIQNTDPTPQELNAYVFNIADGSFLSTVAPTVNTAADPFIKLDPNGQAFFGSGPLLSSANMQFSGSGYSTVGKFVRSDPGEARFQVLSTGAQDATHFNFPTFGLINTGIVMGVDGAYVYTPPKINSVLGTFSIRASRTAAGSFSATQGIGFEWISTDDWSSSLQGTKLYLKLVKTGTNNSYTPITVESVSGTIIRGSTASSATYALQVIDDLDVVLFKVRSDGVITASGPLTAGSLIKSGGSSSQFLKADGSVDATAYLPASSISAYLPLAGGTMVGNLLFTENTYDIGTSGGARPRHGYFKGDIKTYKNGVSNGLVGMGSGDGTRMAPWYYGISESSATGWGLLFSSQKSTSQSAITGYSTYGALLFSTEWSLASGNLVAFANNYSIVFKVDYLGNGTFSGSVKTGAPSGGTAAAVKFGTVASVSPTAPNRTIEYEVNGTTYYLAAKTTNN